MSTTIYVDNDSLLTLDGLKNGLAAGDTGLTTLTVGTATTITRAAGDFEADGFVAGQQIETTGFPTAANNGTFTLTTVATTTLTIQEGGLTAESGDGSERVVGYDYINDAAVAVTLTDSSGTEVTGTSWPLTMSYVTSSDGIYRATLADTLSLTAGSTYTATISANGGAGLQGTFIMTLKAKARKV